MTGPYHGLRILDLSHVIAGPFATHLLADMGADVVRIEPRSGDLMRSLPVSYDDDLSSAFAQYNCGKRSVSVDLKESEGLEIALRLAEWSDVVVENFSPGTLDRLGLSYTSLQERNPDIILCSLSTFGATGPYAHLSGFGAVAEAYSGMMSLTGEEGGPPMHFGTALADTNSGVHAVAAIGAALFRRQLTGAGTHIDISSFDTLFAMIDQAVSLGQFTDGNRSFGRYGRTHSMTVPTGIIGTADGQHVTYGCPGDKLFAALAAAMEQPGLAEDERFSTAERRVANQHALYELIDEWGSRFETADALVSLLSSHGISAARIRHVDENLRDPHLIERGTLSSVDFGRQGERLVQTAPYRFAGADVGPQGAAPHVGEHTIPVLRDVLHLDAEHIRRLLDEGIAYSYSNERNI